MYSSDNGVNRSSFHRSLGQRFLSKGWERSQYSMLKKEETTTVEVIDDLEIINSQIEQHFVRGQQ
jgi:hypothetical protein